MSTKPKVLVMGDAFEDTGDYPMLERYIEYANSFKTVPLFSNVKRSCFLLEERRVWQEAALPTHLKNRKVLEKIDRNITSPCAWSCQECAFHSENAFYITRFYDDIDFEWVDKEDVDLWHYRFKTAKAEEGKEYKSFTEKMRVIVAERSNES